MPCDKNTTDYTDSYLDRFLSQNCIGILRIRVCIELPIVVCQVISKINARKVIENQMNNVQRNFEKIIQHTNIQKKIKGKIGPSKYPTLACLVGKYFAWPITLLQCYIFTEFVVIFWQKNLSSGRFDVQMQQKFALKLNSTYTTSQIY